MTDEQLEAVALREQDEEVCFRADFETTKQEIHLTPGMAVTWPQTAPHRVQNDNCMNVSLSCEFMTLQGLLKANAIYANGVLRRQFKLRPKLLTSSHTHLMIKAGLARVIKGLRQPIDHAPTPISFEISRDSLAPTPLDHLQTKAALT